MAVSSIKGCWYKFSARVRDYLDVVDSYYRPGDDQCHSAGLQTNGSANNRNGGHTCDQHHRSSAKDNKRNSNNNNSKSSHRHHHNCTDQAKHHHQISRAQLPPGYSKRKTSKGQVYFVDSHGHIYWYDPSVPKELLGASLNLDSLVGRLSPTWEIKQTSSGRTYYVNHIKKTTQFTDPRLVAYKDHLMSILKHAQCATTANQTGIILSTSSRHSNGPNNNNVGAGSLSSTGFNPNTTTNSTNATLATTTTSAQGSTNRQPTYNTCPHNQLNSAFASHNHHNRHNAHRPISPISGANFSRRQICPTTHTLDNQYHRNLLSGSHHNLSTITNNTTTSANHSNTLIGPPPAWFKPAATIISSIRKQTSSNDNGSGNNYNNNVETTTTTAAAIRTTDLQNGMNHSGSISNLFPFSANMTSFDYQGQPRSNKELFDKISILRQELLKQQVIPHPCRIDVSRKRIFEESFRVVSQMQPRDLKKRLLVKFRGEEGLDYGGVAREWFYLLSREILNPVHGLFQYTSDDIYNLQINPDSGIVYREHLSYLNFCGRVIGMAVFHGHFIEGHFTLPFYKMLLKKPITLGDIEYVDPELHRSLCWILDNDITNVIDTTFLVQHNAFGQLQEHELKDNGRNIVVTEDNKHEYVSLYVNYRCRRGIESQFEALQRGFYELIPSSLVEVFDEHELELLIGGLSKINIEDWRIHTKLKNCTVETPLVRWFWDIVKTYGEDKRARLLQFVTGSPRVPIQGFKALQGVNSELRLFTIHLIKNACTDDLPKSHTCFNRIDLPPYESYEKLRDKLTQAIEETMGFAMQ